MHQSIPTHNTTQVSCTFYTEFPLIWLLPKKDRKKLGKTPFFYPDEAKKRTWVDQAIDPCVKGKERALQKRETGK